MGKTRPVRASVDYDSSSSDLSEDDQPTLDANRYQSASMQQGLTTRYCRLSAVRELHQVIVHGYRTAPKKLQSAVFEDLLVAVRQPDSRAAVMEAMSQLVAAAKCVLPQQKRNQLMKEQRQAAVAANRVARRHDGTALGGVDTEEQEAALVLGDVPLEVVRAILQALDPASLACTACVCRSWRKLATEDELWQQHLQVAFPVVTKQLQRCCTQQQQQEEHTASSPRGRATTTHMRTASRSCSSHGNTSGRTGQVLYQQFAAAATRHPAAVLQWRSCQVLVSGRLQWITPGSTCVNNAAAVKAARRGGILAGPAYVTPAQAVRWLLGSSWTSVFTDDSDSGSSSSCSDAGSSSNSSDGEESHTHGGKVAAKALRMWAIRS